MTAHFATLTPIDVNTLYSKAPLDHYLMYFNKMELIPVDGGAPVSPGRR